MYIAKKPILIMSTGERFKAGTSIGESQVPESILKNMMDEGVIEEVKPEAKKRKPKVKDESNI